MKRILLLIIVLFGFGVQLRPVFSSEKRRCLAPVSVLKNQQVILASVQSRIFKARRMIDRRKNFFLQGLKQLDFKDLNLRFLDMGNEYYIFTLPEYPHLVFKIPRTLHPLCYPVQYVNMKLIELFLQEKGKLSFRKIDGFSLNSIPGFMPYLFSHGLVIQERAEVILEDDEAIMDKLIKTIEENGIMNLDPSGGNIGIVNRKTEPEPLFIDMGLVTLRNRELSLAVSKTDPSSVLKTSKDIRRFIMRPDTVLSSLRDTVFYYYMASNLNPDKIMQELLEFMTEEEALMSYYYYQALLEKKTHNEALEEAFYYYCLYKKEREKRLEFLERNSMDFLKELLKSA